MSGSIVTKAPFSSCTCTHLRSDKGRTPGNCGCRRLVRPTAMTVCCVSQKWIRCYNQLIISILGPEMNPGHLSPSCPLSFPKHIEVNQIKLGLRLHRVANFQDSLTRQPPDSSCKLMGSFWFGYGDSTVREPPSGFLLTWVRCKPAATAR